MNIEISGGMFSPRVVFCGSVTTEYDQMEKIKPIILEYGNKYDPIVAIPYRNMDGVLKFPDLFYQQRGYIDKIKMADMVFFFPKEVLSVQKFEEHGIVETIQPWSLKILFLKNAMRKMSLPTVLDQFKFGECTSYELAMAIDMNKHIVFVLNGKEIV